MLKPKPPQTSFYGSYIHQDHLTGTSVMSEDDGDLISSIKYLPFGGARTSKILPSAVISVGSGTR